MYSTGWEAQAGEDRFRRFGGSFCGHAEWERGVLGRFCSSRQKSVGRNIAATVEALKWTEVLENEVIEAKFYENIDEKCRLQLIETSMG
jgi:hypothetical protein